MKRKLTTLEYALLGLLAGVPMSGYDIKRLFEATPLGHFSSSPGVIYPALKRLAAMGLLSADLDSSTEARPRRVYSLTPAGTEVLDAWLRMPVTRDELICDGKAPLLRFSFMDGHLPAGEIIAYLDGLRGVVDGYLDELDVCRRDMAGHASTVARLALLNGIQGYRTLSAWAREAMETIRRERENES